MRRQRDDRLEPGQIFEGRSGTGSTFKVEKVDLDKATVHCREIMDDKRGPKAELPISDFLAAYRLRR